MAHCVNEYGYDPKELAEGGDLRTMNRRNRWCEREATTTRTPPMMKKDPAVQRDLCRWCAAMWDEQRDELDAESRVS